MKKNSSSDVIPLPEYFFSANRAEQFLKDYDARQPRFPDKAGKMRLKSYLDKADRLLKGMISLYVNCYRKRVSELPAHLFPELPQLLTNAGQLSKKANRTEKATKTLREKLVTAGVTLEKEVTAGSKGIIIYIHPDILWETSTPGQKKEWERLSGQPFQSLFSGLTPKFLTPSFSTGNHKKRESTNSVVDKGKNAGESQKMVVVSGKSAYAQETTESGKVAVAQETQETTAGNEGWQAAPAKVTVFMNYQKAENERVRSSSPPKGPQENKTPGGRAAHPQSGFITRDAMIAYIEHFWKFARLVLYPYHQFSAEQEREYKNLIWSSVYMPYKSRHPQASRQEWENFHEVCIERIKLAGRYVAKGSDQGRERFIPPPYQYFSANNANGFAATQDWYYRHLTVKNNVNKQLTLRKALEAKKVTIPMHLRKSRYQLWQAEFNRLSKLKNEMLFQAYVASTQPFTVPAFYR